MCSLSMADRQQNRFSQTAPHPPLYLDLSSVCYSKIVQKQCTPMVNPMCNGHAERQCVMYNFSPYIVVESSNRATTQRFTIVNCHPGQVDEHTCQSEHGAQEQKSLIPKPTCLLQFQCRDLEE